MGAPLGEFMPTQMHDLALLTRWRSVQGVVAPTTNQRLRLSFHLGLSNLCGPDALFYLVVNLFRFTHLGRNARRNEISRQTQCAAEWRRSETIMQRPAVFWQPGSRPQRKQVVLPRRRSFRRCMKCKTHPRQKCT